MGPKRWFGRVAAAAAGDAGQGGHRQGERGGGAAERLFDPRRLRHLQEGNHQQVRSKDTPVITIESECWFATLCL